jgi:hypothetical protein
MIHFCDDPRVALCGEATESFPDGTSNAFEHVTCPACRCRIRETRLAPVGFQGPATWPFKRDRSRLTHVAIRFRGETYALPAPNRHHHVIWKIVRRNPDVSTVDGDEEGFLDEGGHFLTREQALINAHLHNQLRCEPRGVLTSEDLW